MEFMSHSLLRFVATLVAPNHEGRMELREAKAAILGGAAFGDVFPLVDELSRDELRHWFVTTDGLPRNRKSASRDARPKPKPAPVATGDLCRDCGGLMVRTGTCLTCSSCGTSSGGCG